MSFIWIETPESRRRRAGFKSADASATLEYVGFGSIDDSEIEAALLVEMPASFRGLPLLTWELDPLGGDVWAGRGNYSSKDKPETPDTGDIRFSFDTTGETAHVTQSLDTTKYSPAGQTAPDYQGAIGVGPNDSIAGVDIPAPGLKFSWTYRMPFGDLTMDYAKTVAGMTGKSNAEPWKGFDAGELTFLGATGEEKTQGDASVTFHFKASRNITDLETGGITISSKLGCQYLWFAYAKTEDDEASFTVPNPIGAYVETVIETADFTELGIGE